MPSTIRAVLFGLLFLALPLPPAPVESLGVPTLDPAFVRGRLNETIPLPTSLAFGPDGRLYVAAFSEIRALTLDPTTHQVLAAELVADGQELVLGIAFDPTAPASPVTVYASRQEPSATDGFQGVVSKFTAPSWAREDVITGLPTSAPFSNHYTNGIAFDDTGRLFIAQGSSTDAGLADASWPETPLSAAILVADINAPGFDGAITYSPPGPPADDNVDQMSGDVAVYAPGVRNPYDLVLHSNGLIYATDNGPMGSAFSISCEKISGQSSEADELNLIEEGNYYGHPNRNRGRADPRQCTYHAGDEGSGAGFTGPIAVLPAHCSCDGIAEYTGAAFDGGMLGDLIYAEFIRRNVSRAVLSEDGRSVVSISTLASALGQPLDVTVGPDGTIYIAEFDAEAVAYLAPDSDRDGCADAREPGASPTLGGQRDPASFWDFYDVPAGTPLQRDQRVNIIDIGAIVLRFGAVSDQPPTKQDALAEALTTPLDLTSYHAAYDRGGPIPGEDLWDLQGPDGAINILDIGAAVIQFGHTCVPV